MVNLDEIKITRRDTEVLKLLVEGCSNRKLPRNCTSVRARSNSIYALYSSGRVFGTAAKG